MAKRDPQIFQARRRRRIARRRGEILDAAARVFAAKGYADTTTKEIAEAADVAEGTLYNYFDSKREILLAIVDRVQSDIEAILREMDELKGREDIITLVEKEFDVLTSHLPFTRTLVMEAWVDDAILQDYMVEHLGHVIQQVQKFIATRIRAGVFRPVDPALATRMALGMFVAPLLPVLRGVTLPLPSPEERHALAEAAVDLLLNGIRVRRNEDKEIEC